jgi:hypothetical protein
MKSDVFYGLQRVLIVIFWAGYADIEQQRAATTQHESDPTFATAFARIYCAWFETNGIAGAHADLSGLSFWGADLRKSLLREADLGLQPDHAQLDGAVLCGLVYPVLLCGAPTCVKPISEIPIFTGPSLITRTWEAQTCAARISLTPRSGERILRAQI